MYTNANCCFTSPSRSAVCTVLPKLIMIIKKNELWTKKKRVVPEEETDFCSCVKANKSAVSQRSTHLHSDKEEPITEWKHGWNENKFLPRTHALFCFTRLQWDPMFLLKKNSKNLHEYALKLDKAESGRQKWIKIKCQSAKLACE